MNKKYNLSDEEVEAFHDVIKDIKENNRITHKYEDTKRKQAHTSQWNFDTEWSQKTIQRAADFITCLDTNDALTFWQSIGSGPNANHNISKLHVAVSSDGIMVKDHLIKILTKSQNGQ